MNKKNVLNQIHIGIYQRDISNKGELVKTLGISLLGLVIFIGQIFLFKDSIMSSIRSIDLLNFREIMDKYQYIKTSNNSEQISMIAFVYLITIGVISIVWMILCSYILFLKDIIITPQNRMFRLIIGLIISPFILFLISMTLIPWKFQISAFTWSIILVIAMIVKSVNKWMNKIKESPIIIKDNIAKDVLNKLRK